MSEWREEKLSQHIGLRHGYQFRETDFTETGIQVIKIGNVTANGLNLESDVSFVSVARTKEFENITLAEGDILMSLTGNIGRVVEVKNLQNKILFQNYRVGVFYPLTDEVYKPFIKWILSSDQILRQLNTHANQSAQANFGKQDLDKLKFRIPSISAQRKITRILSTADAVIEKTQAAIAKYKAIKQGMLHDLFTRGIDPATNKLRPTYEDAPHLYNPSKLGWIPKEWEVKNIIDLSLNGLKNGYFKKPEYVGWGYKLINVTDLYQPFEIDIKQKSVERVFANAEDYAKYEVQIGDIFFTRSSLVLEGIAHCNIILNLPEKAVWECHVIRLRPNIQKINPVYLNYYCKTHEARLFFTSIAKQVTMTTISQPDISKLLIPFPNELNEQKKIAKRLKTIENKIQAEQTYLHKMKHIKAGLMADLLSGKKKVTVDEEPSN
jgi:type I restriction enzyme S subunit